MADLAFLFGFWVAVLVTADLTIRLALGLAGVLLVRSASFFVAPVAGLLEGTSRCRQSAGSVRRSRPSPLFGDG